MSARGKRLARFHLFLGWFAWRQGSRRGKPPCVECALREVLQLVSGRGDALVFAGAKGGERGRGRPPEHLVAWAAGCVAAYTARSSRSGAPDWRLTMATLKDWGIDPVLGARSPDERHVKDRLRHLVKRHERTARPRSLRTKITERIPSARKI